MKIFQTWIHPCFSKTRDPENERILLCILHVESQPLFLTNYSLLRLSKHPVCLQIKETSRKHQQEKIKIVFFSHIRFNAWPEWNSGDWSSGLHGVTDHYGVEGNF